VERGAIYSSSPTVLRSGLVYESIRAVHYVLRWSHDHRIDEFAFGGEALAPLALSPDGPIRFELVSHGASLFKLLDPVTGKVVSQFAASQIDSLRPVPSPDGKWLAVTVQQIGTKQVWLHSARISEDCRGGHSDLRTAAGILALFLCVLAMNTSKAADFQAPSTDTAARSSAGRNRSGWRWTGVLFVLR
jgi:hypothetical protein